MTTFGKTLLLAAAGFMVSAGAVTVSTTSASAAVVCNSDGDCWRVRGRPHYRPELGLRIYGDNWHWRRGERYRWRERGHGHGYYRSGVWVHID